MTITDEAKQRLRELLPDDARGFRFEGWVGTCRGSTPILKPASQPTEDEEEIAENGAVFFAKPDRADILRTVRLDYEPGLFGRGLRMIWAHREGCSCRNA